MPENPHFRELLQILNDFEVRYLTVHGYAVMKYTEPRYTKDLDVWVENTADNASRVFGALQQFGVPLESDAITPETSLVMKITYQIGVAPLRIDILTHYRCRFLRAWKGRVTGTVFGIPVPFISRDDLIANKRVTGRSSDLDPLQHISKKMGSGNQN